MSEPGLIGAISKTVSQLFSPRFRSVLWKSLGLTIALFIGFWLILQASYSAFLAPFLADYSWANTMLAWLLGAGLVLGMGFLVAPVSSVFAGVFLDEIADEVEQRHYPEDPQGTPLALGESIGITARFFGLVVIGNLIALLLVLFLGLGVLIFFLLNGYLLGREYFQFAALRHHTYAEVTEMQKRFGSEIFFAGLAIAALLLVPIVNFLTPLFAGALMVHVYKRISRKSARN
ncbi:MAG: sulfate transporter family protein [Rhizobiaceae bacterium]